MIKQLLKKISQKAKIIKTDKRPIITTPHEYGYSKGEKMKIKPSDLGLEELKKKFRK